MQHLGLEYSFFALLAVSSAGVGFAADGFNDSHSSPKTLHHMRIAKHINCINFI
jgi:hypothetical protein